MIDRGSRQRLHRREGQYKRWADVGQHELGVEKQRIPTRLYVIDWKVLYSFPQSPKQGLRFEAETDTSPYSEIPLVAGKERSVVIQVLEAPKDRRGIDL